MTTIREMGLRKLDLGDRVFFTHRATSVKAAGQGETRYSGEGRDLTTGDHYRQFGRQAGPYAQTFQHPSRGWPAPKRQQRYGPHRGPTRLNRWVVVWPEQGTGMIVGLTYRSEGWTRMGGYEDGNEFEEMERYPLYQVRAQLNGAIRLVPPFACVPLDEKRVATMGDEIPLVFDNSEPHWFSTDDERQPTWADYVEDVFRLRRYRTKTGRILTDADIDALADEAERGYPVG